ncbi:MAG TPA: hypothetical protein DCP32_02005 [Anaerolineaceae bacterium]|nr:MAG: hypothetical protein A2X24_02620 [Chloroflexi bacterium GWB2_54_36]HAL15553.1 hypothetical protein [Anaerolineaceae bacterium]HBA90990.1 hypothetical protein [Anaerolineaceae bacterium]
MDIQLEESKSVKFSTMVYQALLELYPRNFKSEYSNLMAQVFRDSCLRAVDRSTPGGLLGLWGFTLIDTFVSIIEQYSNRGAEMTQSKWIKMSGWLMALSGLFIVLSIFASSRPVFNEANAASLPIDRFLKPAASPLMVISILCLTAGVLGLRSRFFATASRLGRTGLVISLVGTVAAVVGAIGLGIVDQSPWWQTLMLGVTAAMLGLVLFGIDAQRKKFFSTANFLPILIGLPWLALLLADILLDVVTKVNSQLPDIAFAITTAVTIFGLIALGVLLARSTTKSMTPAT